MTFSNGAETVTAFCGGNGNDTVRAGSGRDLLREAGKQIACTTAQPETSMTEAWKRPLQQPITRCTGTLL